MSKSSSALYAVRNVKGIISQETFTVDLYFLCTFYYDLWYNFGG